MSESGHDVAIIGMACLFPQAANLRAFWNNILGKVDAISDPPADWGADLVYDPASSDNDRLYTKRGGYLGDLTDFDPLAYGVMPRAVDGGEPEHFIALRVAHEALADAGYLNRSEHRQRTAVILGRGTYVNRGYITVLQHTIAVEQTLRVLRALRPEYTDEELQAIKRELKASLPPFNQETAPGLVPSVMCGRIANRLDLMGPAFAVDAACASSLIAVELGMSDLVNRRCDLVLAGGIQVSSTFPITLIFCQLGGLSRSGSLRPFHAGADGTLLGEGAGVVVLKRREDAERDGDRIYAVLKAIGRASDGRALGLLAPRTEGEELALRRSYELAGVSPHTVELVEAHGTGTPVGDAAELEALARVFGGREGNGPSRALGSVKGMIGHTIPAAGVAGIIKAALSLYHKILPPTLHEGPHNAKLDATTFYLNTETRPWVHGGAQPRRAGVSAFGFGGINAHAILEEHNGEASVNTHRAFDTEVFVLAARSRQELTAKAAQLHSFVSQNPEAPLIDLAYSVNCPLPSESPLRLSVVATDTGDLGRKLEYALRKLSDPSVRRIRERSGIYFLETPPWREAKLAFLFPGEGAQYVNMLADLCIHFPEVRSWFDLIDRAFVNRQRSYLPSQAIFPPPDGVSESGGEQMLWRMDCGTEAIFAANQALLTLLGRLGVRAQAILGHSTGEYSALCASGALRFDDDDDLMCSLISLNRVYEELRAEGQIPEATLMTVGAPDREAVLAVVEQSAGQLTVSMDNCPHQTVLCGTKEATLRAADRLGREGAICTPLPFSRAYHTPQFSCFSERLAGFFRQLKIFPPEVDLYSCATAGLYPQDPDEIRRLAVEQWSRPVRFRETIEAMYAAGVRVFVEVGPRGNLTAFVDDILRGRPYLAVPSNVRHRSGITQLNHLMGLLAAHGTHINLEHLYARRTPEQLSLDRPGAHHGGNGTNSRSVKVSTALPVIKLPRPELTDNLKRESAPPPPTFGSAALSDGNGTRREIPPAAAHLVSALPQPREDERTTVMLEYLQTMERFLQIQKTMTGTFIASGRQASVDDRYLDMSSRGETFGANRGGPEEQDAPAATDSQPQRAAQPPSPDQRVDVESYLDAPPTLHFIDRVVSFVPGEELTAIRQLDLSRDIFLRDHTLGGTVSVTDSSLTALPVVPLTVSMEILAEAAAMLCPGLRVVGFRDVRAFRWIALEGERLTLQLSARVKADTLAPEVEVKIYEIDGDSATAQTRPDALRVEGTVVFGKSYPEPPPLAEFCLRSERPSHWLPERLYTDYMFHGPSLRGVASIERWGEDGTEATLSALPADKLFRDVTNPRFLSDPVMLDAAGQLVGYWIAEHQARGFHVFPVSVTEVRFYGPSLRAGELARCSVRATLVGQWQVESDIDVIGPDGSLLAQLVGWKDKRLEVPEQFYRFRISPRDTTLASRLNDIFSQAPEPKAVCCCLLDGLTQEYLEANGGIWQSVLAHLVLSQREREVWRNLEGADEDLTAWLLGRAVAKDAARLFLKDHAGLELYPADVEILEDDRGRLHAGVARSQTTARPLLISVARANSAVVAAACAEEQFRGLGVEMNSLAHAIEFGVHNFTPAEQDLISSRNGLTEDEITMRLWCAKEATVKALGHSFAGASKDLVVRRADVRTGAVELGLVGESTRLFSDFADMILTVNTMREGNLIIATALLKGNENGTGGNDDLSR